MIKKILGVMRGPFLLLVPASLSPAFVVAWQHSGTLEIIPAVLVVLAALAAHIAVNALNEYEDFRSGLDFATTRTPFSGGSGTLVEDTDFAPAALFIGWIGVLLTFSIGLYFVWRNGLAVVAPGLLGLAIIIGYTRWINRYPLLCLFAPGIGFGLLYINLAVLVLVGHLPLQAIWVSVPVTLLVSNLLLVNQLPDIEADRRVGRNHVPIAWGVNRAARVSIALLAGCYLTVLVGVVIGLLPMPALLAGLTLPLAIQVARKVSAFDGSQPQDLVPGMGANVVVTLVTPVLLAAGLALG